MSALFNCNEATLLIEKRAEQPLTLWQRLCLWIHLSMCSLCNRYARQSPLIAALARRRGCSDEAGEDLSAEALARLETVFRDAGIPPVAAAAPPEAPAN